jgi:hypothetical protein
MDGRLFTLVSEDDHEGIFAWGMEITHPGGRTAVIYRWDPTTRQSTQGVHSSAEGARVLYSRIAGIPLALVDAEHSPVL